MSNAVERLGARNAIIEAWKRIGELEEKVNALESAVQILSAALDELEARNDVDTKRD